MKLSDHTVHVETLTASGGAETKEVAVIRQLVTPFFPCYINSDRHTLPVRIVNFERCFLVVLDALLIHQAGSGITECQEAVIICIHAVAISGKELTKVPVGYRLFC